MGPNLTNSGRESNNQLDPVIKIVLGCLDINLENELSLYRKNKRLQEKINAVGSMGGYRSSQSPGVIINTTTEIETSSIALNATDHAGVDNGNVLSAEDNETDISNNQVTVASPTVSEQVIEGDVNAPRQAIIKTQDILPNASLVPKENSLAIKDERETNIANNLLTPLGLLSMLLFFLSCIGLGYLLNSPNTVNTVNTVNNFNWQSWLRKTPVEPISQSTPTPTATASINLSINPDLTSREFINLQLDTLSNINPDAIPVPTPTPQITIPPVPSPVNTNKNTVNQGNQASNGLNNLSTTLLPPPPSVIPPAVSPSPAKTISPSASSSPKISPSSVTNSPNTIPLKSKDGLYYVITNYVDEASWQQARRVVPDAYIREGSDGSRKIQLGAFNDEKSARKFVQELQDKGLMGQYYSF